MGVYDEALAKSLVGEGFAELDRYMGAESIEKSHVKAHFRKNAKTGKLEHIADYDDARHAHEVAAKFERGDKVKVNNPNSKHHGKELVVSSYSDKFNKIRGRVADHDSQVDVDPNHLEYAEGDKKLDAPKSEEKKTQAVPADSADKKLERRQSAWSVGRKKMRDHIESNAVRAEAAGRSVLYYDKDGKQIAERTEGDHAAAKAYAEKENALFAERDKGPAGKKDTSSDGEKKDGAGDKKSAAGDKGKTPSKGSSGASADKKDERMKKDAPGDKKPKSEAKPGSKEKKDTEASGNTSAIADVLRKNKAMLTSGTGGVHMVHKGNTFSINFKDSTGHAHSVTATVGVGTDKKPSWKIDSAEGAGVGSGKSVVDEKEVADAMERIFKKAKSDTDLQNQNDLAANSGIDFMGQAADSKDKKSLKKGMTYDEAMAKALETGDFSSLDQYMGISTSKKD